jgi:hypothetical protein
MSDDNAVIELLREAIGVIDEFLDDLDGEVSPFLNAGCNHCTEGCTPARFDTGLCWYHRAKKLLRGVGESEIKERRKGK